MLDLRKRITDLEVGKIVWREKEVLDLEKKVFGLEEENKSWKKIEEDDEKRRREEEEKEKERWREK